MKLFHCDHCGHLLYFENVRCERCGHRLGYEPDANVLVSLDGGEAVWTAPALGGAEFVFCANAAFDACNWLVPHQPGGDPYCRACRHNALVPPLEDVADLARWQVIERAKKRLVYSLLRLRLPLATRSQDALHGLAFQFPREDIAVVPVVTGHESGLITIALLEADDAAREYRRTQLREPYRTLLGHFRHEIGHHYWDILVNGQPAHARFRELFGDESADYQAGLQLHYANGAAPGWQQTHVSAYATAHPWEDFAETFAHYLHLVDTTEMAAAFGVRLRPSVDKEGVLAARLDFDPYDGGGIEALVDNWVPLASLINNLNRAVGQQDAYPFILTPQVIEKLGFVADLVHAAGAVQWTVPGPDGPVPINRPSPIPELSTPAS